jgi:hypothetical protein
MVDSYCKVMNWLHANDWRWFAAFLVCQITSVLSFFWFAYWISNYAKLNWY